MHLTELVMKEKIFLHAQKPPHRWEGISEPHGPMAVDAQTAKRRDSTTEFVPKRTFQPKSGSQGCAHSRKWKQSAEAQSWVSGPRERTVVGCCKDTLKGLVQYSWVSRRSKNTLNSLLATKISKTGMSTSSRTRYDCSL